MFSAAVDAHQSTPAQPVRQPTARGDMPARQDSFSSLVDSNNADADSGRADTVRNEPRRDKNAVSAAPSTRTDVNRVDDIQQPVQSRRTERADAPSKDATSGTDSPRSAPSYTRNAADAPAAADEPDTEDNVTARTAAVDPLAILAMQERQAAAAAGAITDADVSLEVPTVAGQTNPNAPLAIAAAVLKAQAEALTEAGAETAEPQAVPAPATPNSDPSIDAEFAKMIAAANLHQTKGEQKQAGADTETAPDAEAVPAGMTLDTDGSNQDVLKQASAVSGDETQEGAAAEKQDAKSDQAPKMSSLNRSDVASGQTPSITSTPADIQPNAPVHGIQQPTPVTLAAATQVTATVATGAPVQLKDLAVEIAVTAQTGMNRFNIRLDPAELGRIDVQLDVDRNGKVTSHLVVEKPETLAMLRQDAPQLQRALEQAGLKTGDDGLQFSLRDESQGRHSNDNESNPHSRKLVISEEEIVPAAVLGRGYGRMAGQLSGVDIRI